MKQLRVSCLGSGAALSQGRLWSCLLLEERLLLGLPPSAIPEFYRRKKDPAALETIFISHLHADHYFGIPFLLLPYRMGLLERSEPLRIVGPSGIADRAYEICHLAWPGIHTEGCLEGLPVEFTEIHGEGEGRVGALSFEAVRTSHFEMLSYGFKIELNGRTIGFTGDTGDCEGLDRIADGVDLLITEFTHTDPDGFCTDGHLGAATIRRLAKRLRERDVPIVATHLGGEPPAIDGVLVVEDGGEYTL